MKKDIELLQEAASHWSAMATFRSDRDRCKRYCYGRQWDDLIEVDGRLVKEEEYIRLQGNIPLKNNLIRRLVRSVLGVFRNQYTYPSPIALELSEEIAEDKTLYARLILNAQRNRLEELHARTMEEFLISGMAVHRKSLTAQDSDVSRGGVPISVTRTDYVSPETFFVDSSARDFRGWDVRMLGQIHDVDFSSLCASLAQSQEEMAELRSVYHIDDKGTTSRYSFANFGKGDGGRASNFYASSDPTKCRVIEVWRKESLERYQIHDRATGELFKLQPADAIRLLSSADSGNRYVASWMMDEVWTFHFLSPEGDVLAEGISPIADGGHPYVWKAYPFIDGEIHSFVADVIDQQRHTNRLITLYDWVIRSSAKGVLLFPESALPDGVEIDDISDEWSRFNGVILFRPKAGVPLPQQVSGCASQAGITDLLNIQMKMFEDVSGVNGALEGKLTNNNVSGTLYNQQTRQAMTALLDILESYNSFILEGARLDLRLDKYVRA